MSNHDHLLFETPEVGLSGGMKWLNQKYAEAFNARHRRVGHLFQGRFKGILVERGVSPSGARSLPRAESRLAAGDAFRRRLPVEQRPFYGRAGSSAAMVRDGLETGWTLDQFHPGHRVAAQELYRQFVADGRGASYKPWETLPGQMFLGGAGFCDRMQQLVRSEARSREHPRQQREFVRPSFEAIIENVASVFAGHSRGAENQVPGRGEKGALAQLALDEGGLTLRSVAEWLGVWRLGGIEDAAHRARTVRFECRRPPVHQRNPASVKLIFQM